jgi:hypothetical protein
MENKTRCGNKQNPRIALESLTPILGAGEILNFCNSHPNYCGVLTPVDPTGLNDWGDRRILIDTTPKSASFNWDTVYCKKVSADAVSPGDQIAIEYRKESGKMLKLGRLKKKGTSWVVESWEYRPGPEKLQFKKSELLNVYSVNAIAQSMFDLEEHLKRNSKGGVSHEN